MMKTGSPFVVAEMSGNHNQSLKRAMEIVDAAADAGAHAIKLQTYTADTMTLDIREGEFLITNTASPWHGRSLYDLYEEAHTPWEWHAPLFERAWALGMMPFSTPFDGTSVEFLESIECPVYKIASFEMVDIPLIRRVAATRKPMIMSTGMCSEAEIEAAAAAAREGGCPQVVLLKCTSSYPASPKHSNLRAMEKLRAFHDGPVGLSDHTLGVGVACAAVALGACVIEKHFTLRRADGGPDAAFSMEPAEFAALVTATRDAWLALGSDRLEPGETERGSLVFRRSLYVVRDLKAGDVLGPDDVRSIRPGYGLPPGEMDRVLGRRLRRDVRRGTPLSWELLEAQTAR